MSTAAQAYFHEAKRLLDELPTGELDAIVQAVLDAYDRDSAIYLIGNGGSAAISSHIATDMSKSTLTPAKRPARVMSLTDNTPLITAWANDFGYDQVFVGQLESLMRAGDVVLATSSSGRSPNVIRAIEWALEHGGIVLGLAGFGGGDLARLAHHCVIVASDDYQHVEDTHLALGHIIFRSLLAHIQAG